MNKNKHKENNFPSQFFVFSGIQPTGRIHIGNYFGAMRRFSKLQSQYKSFYCIVDMHAITMPYKPQEMRSSIYYVTAAFLAAGLSTGQSALFRQSSVSFHASLSWLLSCVARIGWLSRMTQFKSKTEKDRINASVGLYTYPILMASDILLYRTSFVPVGEDQKQHVELARNIAQKCNSDFGTNFVLPAPLIEKNAKRIMNLQDPEKKMSKSDKSDLTRIHLEDSADQIARKIRKARTDSESVPSDNSKREERLYAFHLLDLYAAATDKDVSELFSAYGGCKFSVLKKDLTDCLVDILMPVRERLLTYLEDKHALDVVLEEGSAHAFQHTKGFYQDVCDKFGF